MTNAKHTPGPFFSTCPYGGTIYIEARLRERTIQEVAAVGPTEAGRDQQEANARLFVAAPDLLKELCSVVENEEQGLFEQWLSRNTPSGDCDSVHSQWLESADYQDFCDLWAAPISAIAKARGES